MLTVGSASFLDVLQVHQNLEELFLQHQEALLELDPQSALNRLLAYHRELIAHIEVEETLLLPVYERAGKIAGGPPEFFTGEHRRMREHLERFVATLRERNRDRSGLMRRIIRLFDEEAAFKSLCHHHDQRERNILFPALNRVTSLEERRWLVHKALEATSIWVTSEASAGPCAAVRQ